jgi:hypothetical protein
MTTIPISDLKEMVRQSVLNRELRESEAKRLEHQEWLELHRPRARLWIRHNLEKTLLKMAEKETNSLFVETGIDDREMNRAIAFILATEYRVDAAASQQEVYMETFRWGVTITVEPTLRSYEIKI